MDKSSKSGSNGVESGCDNNADDITSNGEGDGGGSGSDGEVMVKKEEIIIDTKSNPVVENKNDDKTEPEDQGEEEEDDDIIEKNGVVDSTIETTETNINTSTNGSTLVNDNDNNNFNSNCEESMCIESEDDSHLKNLLLHGIEEKIAQRLCQLFNSHKLSFNDLDERAFEALKDFGSVEGTISVLNEFKESSLEHVSNKSAFLCGLMKKHRAKEKAQASAYQTNSSSSHGANHANPSSPSSSSSKQDQNSSRNQTHPGPNPDKLKAILERTGYTLDVTSGQRKYGGPPPSWEGSPPGAGAEIFVGKIPKEIFEDELIPLFEDCGKIWDLRLMIDPLTGYNRGYCFITYCSKEEAYTAQQKYDGYQIRKGKPLKVNISVPNLRLFVGNIPKSKNKEEIFQEFSKLTAGLLEVIVYTSPDDRRKNRGFCFLEYESHKAASLAKRKLTSGRTKVWGCDILVDWADPQEEPDQETMSKVKVLYVRNLTGDVSEDQLKEMFENFGGIERVKKIKDYAFVHFNDRNEAITAMQELHEKEINGIRIEVSLAKPPSDRKKKEEILRNREKRVMAMMQQKALLIGPTNTRVTSVMPPVPPPIARGMPPMPPPNRVRNRSVNMPSLSPQAYGNRPVPRSYGYDYGYTQYGFDEYPPDYPSASHVSPNYDYGYCNSDGYYSHALYSPPHCPASGPSGMTSTKGPNRALPHAKKVHHQALGKLLLQSSANNAGQSTWSQRH